MFLTEIINGCSSMTYNRSTDFTCARDWIRTSTSLRTLPPESSASTNFATRAHFFRTAILHEEKVSKKFLYPCIF